MKKPKVQARMSVAPRSLEEIGATFLDKWKAIERGEHIEEVSLHFHNLETVLRFLTPKRRDVLKYVRHHPVRTITEIATGVKRSYKNVHQDVSALLEAGLLVKSDKRIEAPYGVIQTEIRF